MVKLWLDVIYLTGSLGVVLLARWAMHMSTPERDWSLLQRITKWGGSCITRLLSRGRVYLWHVTGATQLRWLLLRRKWRLIAASE